MSAIPVPPMPPRDPRIPELTAADVSKLITEYVAQIKYYENPKLWKTYLRNKLWKFAKSKHRNYNQNDLLGYNLKELSKTIIDLVGGDDNFQASKVTTEVTRFTKYYTTVLFDYESYFGEIENVPKMTNINLKDINPNLKSKIDRSYTTLVTWEEFIAMWYRDMDKTRIVPLYLLHQKRFYDWFGNKSLQATIDMMANKPKEKWRYVLKKMCKIGVIDHEYIRHTCDMGCVTEEYLMMETERYIQRYDSQKMTNKNANTNAVSSLDYSYGFSVSRTMTQQLEEEFKY